MNRDYPAIGLLIDRLDPADPDPDAATWHPDHDPEPDLRDPHLD